ncbi:beta-1,3-galactosyltransferase 4 [Sorex fumeus]|uniref:beta-1,3-galactosyltransferase 4 n=1 Tax=Sorex fumeus TaxID=62283 RepID=UPI0024ADF067|nr:beta-1,3-galactosyltransferase 4 [Sorex fumeus]
MPLWPSRRLVLAALLLVLLWTLLGPYGIGEELLSLTLPSLLPGPASPGPPLALPSFLIANEGACGGPGAPPFLLILVCSAVDHLNQRNAIRASWGGLRQARGLRVRTLFLLGQPGPGHPAGAAQEALEQESAAKGDILQAAFLDTYRNLTLKTLSGLNWADKHCPAARYILKTDDDVFVNVPELVSELVRRGGRWARWETGPEPRTEAAAAEDRGRGAQPMVGAPRVPLLYLGRVHWRVYPSRASGSKHRVAEEQWPTARGAFPAYASGTGYVLSASAAQLVLNMASQVPALPLEDVFVGVSSSRGGLTPTHCVRLAGATHYPLDQCCYGKILLTSHKLDPWTMEKAWKLVSGYKEERTAPFCSWYQRTLGIARCRLMAWLHS